jgi:hydroxylamine reductase
MNLLARIFSKISRGIFANYCGGKKMSMFCYQCHEAAGGKGCTVKGICGKTKEVANAQDLLIYICKGVAVYAVKAREVGLITRDADTFIMESLIATGTNENFDKDSIYDMVRKGLSVKFAVRQELSKAGVKFKGDIGWFMKNLSFWGLAKREKELNMPDAATWFARDIKVFEGKANQVGILTTENEDIRSLRELLIYGLKGLASYAKQAENLGHKKDGIHAFIQKALFATLDDTVDAAQLMALILECGKCGVDSMELLDKANTMSYGNPETTIVNIGVRNRQGILVSGHDLKDMEELLMQTEGEGLDVYTHGEMLPANCYPELKKYGHLVGNYGNSWSKQNEEFESFNGPILMTGCCLTNPKDSYKDRLYTTGAADYPGVKHIPVARDGEKKDFSEVIEKAKACQPPVDIEKGSITSGFGQNQLYGITDKIVQAVESGAIKRLFVMAGCDGKAISRSYYTTFAEKLPKDAIIMTAGCAKFRYNKLQLGDINGIPRIIDAGQCSSSYYLVLMAQRLKEALGLDDMNMLPISYNIAWHGHRSVIMLLGLLYLGVKNIHLGPTLPGFLSENVMEVLNKDFGLTGINSAENDIEMFMNV